MSPNISWMSSRRIFTATRITLLKATAHEAGHEFGLNHQSTWSGTTLTAEYNPGNSPTAPIMGNSYSAERGIWWNGTSDVSSTTMQDDMAVISNSTNNFGIPRARSWTIARNSQCSKCFWTDDQRLGNHRKNDRHGLLFFYDRRRHSHA